MDENWKTPLYPIGVVAEMIGVHIDTLRIWESKGLINPERRGKDRYYCKCDLEQLKYIKFLTHEKKVNTYGVQEILKNRPCWEINNCPEEERKKCPDYQPEIKEAGETLLKNQKILVVDDDIDIVMAFKTILEAREYQVVVAFDGDEGLEKVKTEKPDLIILDLMMPKKDGEDVCRKLKSDEKYKDIPIIIVTGISEKMHMKYELDETWLPAEAFVEKPIVPLQFLKQIENLLKIKSKK